MGNHVYICGWSTNNGTFDLWVKAHPNIRGTGESYDHAQEALQDAIVDSGGAKQATFEFVPPLPTSDFDLAYSTPQLYLISGDEGFDADEPRSRSFETDAQRCNRLTWFDDFFQGGICKDCLGPQGPRSSRRLEISSTGNSYDGGFTVFSGAMPRIFSGNFLDILSEQEKSLLDIREIQQAGKTRKKYFELVGPSGPPTVALAGVEVGGWQCEKCGYKTFSYQAEDSAISDFVSMDDLPSPLSEVFTVGIAPKIMLCMTGERWASIVGQIGTSGITSSPLGVAPASKVVRNPQLVTRQELDRRFHTERRENAERDFRSIDYTES